MVSDVTKRSRKAGLPPGSLIYTGDKIAHPSHVDLISYNSTELKEASGPTLAECLPQSLAEGVTWINVVGLQNIDLIKEIGQHYSLHPLVMEDILNTAQRSKVEEFDKYVFVVLKLVVWNPRKNLFNTQQISIIFGTNFLLSFQEEPYDGVTTIADRIRHCQGRLREHNADYLAYTLIDSVIDQYFVVLEGIGEQLESTEEDIMKNPSREKANILYRLKRQLIMFRKAVWPAREVVNNLLRINEALVSSTTLPYLRDVYDHTVQVIDTIETDRDMLGGMLDIYLSSLTNRINEVMKVLTIIATIFIPLTFIASIYGMNFIDMPELRWHYGYPAVLTIMAIVAIIMIIYFRKKKWV